MTLKELRKNKKLTQAECAKYLEIPLRTYQNYETDISKQGTMKYIFMVKKLEEYGYIDEEHGILTIQKIKEICIAIFSNYDIEYCYLFGSYAKGKATQTSDVDLLVSTSISGIKFFDLVEALREALKKKVDVLNQEQLNNNPDLVKEILKDGVKIYG
ncbi:MAG: nucleotidyltransferase domain-containing protein [Clostridia bacterium]|nr:nucleotidyltransferase domain-containing protein [Clostridia bacterium]